MTNNEYYKLLLSQVKMIKAHNRELWPLNDLQQQHYNKILIACNTNTIDLEQDTPHKQKLSDKANKLAKKEFLA